ncbi:riboflavin aldehyde-forming enzyme [Dendrothele bispora CBS 962.96]|uniref:Riboflavin aldehyde-forming enzyme n=1 Tax=Dendrothele bispora (strain CBS 962.96) TaxID=1314807 RepID=A0A4S8MMI5_DENBC|nr:riboflavin aldehyde-forming enzyme [Dendrothele bispora CBS 962.96]
MSRLALFVFALFASFFLAFAAPVSSNNTSTTLEKRVDHFGRGTWFEVGLGNCGQWSVDSDHIVAIAKSRYDANNGGNCGQWVQITDQKNGHVKYGLTLDSCQSCGSGDLDMSPSLFKLFEPLSVGVLNIKWNFMPKGWSP